VWHAWPLSTMVGQAYGLVAGAAHILSAACHCSVRACAHAGGCPWAALHLSDSDSVATQRRICCWRFWQEILQQAQTTMLATWLCCVQ
jgi:hypothetical protein